MFTSIRPRAFLRILLMLYLFTSLSAHSTWAQCNFLRGDANGDGVVNISDVTKIDLWVADHNSVEINLIAADVDDDQDVDSLDADYILAYLFQGGPAPPAPFPNPGTESYPVFIRGDADGNGQVDADDTTHIIVLFFQGASTCPPDAGDVNNDDVMNMDDATYLSNFLAGGPDPITPFPEPGLDPCSVTPMYVSEFMANNDTTLADEDGDFSDWIEIHNRNPYRVDVEGHQIDDDLNRNGAWTFPHMHIEANSELVIFASGKNRAQDNDNELHTNFGLSASGESLRLWNPNNAVLDTYSNFPAQDDDVSYGKVNGVKGYYSKPTPDGPYIKPPNFGTSRGIYTQTINVSLSAGWASSIHYTTDGSIPTTSSTQYTTPISISSTTMLRAVAAKGTDTSDVETHTYIYPSIHTSQTKPASYPTQTEIDDNPFTTPDESTIDYNVVVEPGQTSAFTSALSNAPSVSISMFVDDLFGENPPTGPGGKPVNGIYPNSQTADTTPGYIRDCSFEWIDPSGPDSQINARISVFGGSTRDWMNTKKKNFRLRYDAPQLPHGSTAPGLNFNIFNEASAPLFRGLALRGMGHDSWTISDNAFGFRRDEAVYVNDLFASQTLSDMGVISPKGQFCHLYLNGLYWGVYAIQERPDEHFMANRYGGNSSDYESYNAGSTENASTDYSNQVATLRNSTDFNEVDDILDFQDFIDYIITEIYIQNEDWPIHNFWLGRDMNAGANPSADEKFKYIPWDSEWAVVLGANDSYEYDFSSVTCERIFPFGQSGACPYNTFSGNQNFKNIFSSRLQVHCQGNGALTNANSLSRMQTLLNEYESILEGESARWGDLYSPGNPYNFSDWDVNRDWVRDEWTQKRGYYMFEHFNDFMSLGLNNPYPVP